MQFNFSTYKLDPVTKAGNNLELYCLENSIKTKNPYKTKSMSSANRCKRLCETRYGTQSYSEFDRSRGFLFRSIESVGPKLINCFNNRLTLKRKPRRLMLLSPDRNRLPFGLQCPTEHGRERFSTHSDVMIA